MSKLLARIVRYEISRFDRHIPGEEEGKGRLVTVTHRSDPHFQRWLARKWRVGMKTYDAAGGIVTSYQVPSVRADEMARGIDAAHPDRAEIEKKKVTARVQDESRNPETSALREQNESLLARLEVMEKTLAKVMKSETKGSKAKQAEAVTA